MVKYSVDVAQATGIKLPLSWWQDLLKQTMVHLRYRQSARVSVGVIGDAAMRSIHYQYAGSRKVTDVLSFAERDSVVASRQDGEYLGEIIICYPQTLRQAKEFGHSVRTEMSLLFVHGVLHLLGFDHDTARKANTMRAAETKILGTDISRTTGC